MLSRRKQNKRVIGNFNIRILNKEENLKTRN